MTTFEIMLFEGHPILRDDKNIILIDTGAPSTIHITDQLHFLNETYGASPNYMGLTVYKISELLGMEITTLLGADILSKYKILLDYRNKQVSFSKQPINLGGGVAPISNFMGIPIIDLTVAERKIKCFLDTGAKLSYLPKELTQNYESIGSETDFYPGVGRFTTDCYNIPTSFGDDAFNVKYGNLPGLLQMTLLLAGTNGIIGYDFFDNFKVMLDLQKSKISTVKYVQEIA